MGQVLQAGQGQIPSRQAQIKAGIPKEVSSETVNKVCASGVRATVLLDQAIRAGEVQVGVAGGMESMSQAPYLLPNARFGFRMGDVKALDAMVHDGLTNPFSGKQMFVEATEVGDELELTRADLDRWALRSPRTGDRRRPTRVVCPRRSSRSRSKAARATPSVEVDEAPRRDTSLEVLAKLPGLVGKEGSPHGRQLAGRKRRRRRIGRRLGRVGSGQRQAGAGRDRRARPERRRVRIPRPHPRLGRQEGAGEGGLESPGTSICGRSTRRSPRSR